MNNNTIKKTVANNICVSCGICEAVCPKAAISMKFSEGQYLPDIDHISCNNCGLCLKVCPGIDIMPDTYKKRDLFSSEKQRSSIDARTLYAKDILLRENATSGGIITQIITTLLQNKVYDAAFVVPPINCNRDEIRLSEAGTPEQVFSGAKSKYVPVSAYNVIDVLLKRENKKYIVVATPCVLDGIRKVVRRFKLQEKDLLYLGLFCENTLNLNILEYFDRNYNKAHQNIREFHFRAKHPKGWPGHIRIMFENGKARVIDRSVRMKLKKFFTLERCLFCFDKLNSFADISFGDCYIPGKGSFYGKSDVIVRTKRGSDILKKMDKLFIGETCSFQEVASSQLLETTRKKYDNAIKLDRLIKKQSGGKRTYSGFDRKLKKSISTLQLGKKRKYRSIAMRLFYGKVKGFGMKLIKKGFNYCYSNLVYFSYLLSAVRFSKKQEVSGKPNVLIAGGELFNKGAQAMTFALVDLIAEKYPEKHCVLLSYHDYERGPDEKKQYRFSIFPWSNPIRMRVLSPVNKLFVRNKKYKHKEKEIKHIIKNTSMMIDISGYQLSSQWGVGSSMNLLANIILAGKNKIPYYMFPQSIGPFHYPLHFRLQMWLFLKLILPRPKKIYAREDHGVSSIRPYTRENVIRSFDFVLLTKSPSMKNIYGRKRPVRKHVIKPQSVAIIPNARVFERTNKASIKDAYTQVIDTLLKNKRNVYIIRHAYDDLDVCEEIKSWYADNKKVFLIREDMNCFEIENIVKQFQFVIASRYHSVVHAYKNNVPALVIGWAVKYAELLEAFGQLDNYFDCRTNVSVPDLLQQVKKLMKHYKKEQENIAKKLQELLVQNNFSDF